MTIRARAPANIALIKYMGKRSDPTKGQLPENPSISLTLNELCSGIEIDRELDAKFSATWLAEETPRFGVERPWAQPHWTPIARERAHQRLVLAIERIHAELQAPLRDRWVIRTGNTFPAGTGIASSASFFAALTLATCKALVRGSADADELADISRRLSGSSCRSFFGPWAYWENDQVHALASRLPAMADTVILLETEHKEIGSSDAHQRVKASPNWAGRSARATERARKMVEALRLGDWEAVRTGALQDSDDMHVLFETSIPPFHYRTAASREIIAWASERSWVMATMDAGANVHLLTQRQDQMRLSDDLKKSFGQGLRLLLDTEGHGPTLL